MRPSSKALKWIGLASAGCVALGAMQGVTLAQGAPGQAPEIERSERKLTLVSAGSGEKRELRYSPEAGTKHRVKTTTDATQTQTVFGQEQKMDMSVVSVVEVGVVAGESEGDRQVRLEVISLNVDEKSQAAPMLEPQLAGAVGKTLTWSFDPRGVVDPDSVGGPLAQNAAVTEFVPQPELLMVLLPEEPVGVGAEWKVDQKISGMGFEVQTIVTLKLTALDDQHAEFDVTSTMHAEPQDIKAPGVPPGVRLTKFDGQGTGTMTITFDAAAPRSASFENEIDIMMTMPNMEMQQGRTIKQKIERKPVEE